jgi:hypothetical protein
MPSPTVDPTTAAAAGSRTTRELAKWKRKIEQLSAAAAASAAAAEASIASRAGGSGRGTAARDAAAGGRLEFCGKVLYLDLDEGRTKQEVAKQLLKCGAKVVSAADVAVAVSHRALTALRSPPT